MYKYSHYPWCARAKGWLAALMCGICCVLTTVSPSADAHFSKLPRAICRRGPDAFKIEQVRPRAVDGKGINGTFASSVLHLRGEAIVAQPLVSDRYVLQWNGEIYNDNLQVRLAEKMPTHI